MTPSSSAPALVPLTQLSAGQKACLVEIKLPEQERSRLQELGLLSGTEIALERFAPLGDPIEIKVRGYHLTLRRHEAHAIWVQVIG